MKGGDGASGVLMAATTVVATPAAALAAASAAALASLLPMSHVASAPATSEEALMLVGDADINSCRCLRFVSSTLFIQ